MNTKVKFYRNGWCKTWDKEDKIFHQLLLSRLSIEACYCQQFPHVLTKVSSLVYEVTSGGFMAYGGALFVQIGLEFTFLTSLPLSELLAALRLAWLCEQIKESDLHQWFSCSSHGLGSS